MSWKTIHSELKYQNRYMRVTEDELVTDYGDHVTFGIVRKEPFSVIIPWDGTRFLLVGQYRATAAIFSWEFPMGHAETNDPLTAAKHELREETGLISEELKLLGTFYPALGTMDQLGYIYLVQKWKEGNTSLDISEKGMQMRWVTKAELEALIKDGTIKDGPTITAFKLFELYSLRTR